MCAGPGPSAMQGSVTDTDKKQGSVFVDKKFSLYQEKAYINETKVKQSDNSQAFI